MASWFKKVVIIVQSPSRVQLFVTPWSAAQQAFLSFTISWGLFKLMSFESVMPSNHLILCHPLLLLKMLEMWYKTIFKPIGIKWVSFSFHLKLKNGTRKFPFSAGTSLTLLLYLLIPPFNKEKASFEIQQLGKQHLLEYNTVACFHFIDFSVTFYLWQVIQFYQFP